MWLATFYLLKICTIFHLIFGIAILIKCLISTGEWHMSASTYPPSFRILGPHMDTTTECRSCTLPTPKLLKASTIFWRSAAAVLPSMRTVRHLKGQGQDTPRSFLAIQGSNRPYILLWITPKQISKVNCVQDGLASALIYIRLCSPSTITLCNLPAWCRSSQSSPINYVEF